MKLSETTLKYLASIEASILSERTAAIVGNIGTIKSISCTVQEGEDWKKERAERIASDPKKFGFLKELPLNVKGTITLSLQDKTTKTFYLNAPLLKMLLVGKALVRNAEGEFIPTNDVMEFTSDEIVIKTATPVQTETSLF